MFIGCYWEKQAWFASPLTINFDTNNTSFINWLSKLLSTSNKDTMVTVAAITYQIWHARNNLVFQNKHVPVLEAITKALSTL